MFKELNIIKFIFYFLLFFLLIIYIFPGSLIGLLLYGDSFREPQIVINPIGTSLNHLLFFLLISAFGILSYKKKNLKIKTLFYLSILAILLELLHNFIPNRSFQIVDLLANLFGVIIFYPIILFYAK